MIQRQSSFDNTRRRAHASLSTAAPRRLQPRWQTRRNNVDHRRVMADQNNASPKRHGVRVHRYGPQSARRKLSEQRARTSENNNSVSVTSSIADRTVIGGDNNVSSADRGTPDDVTEGALPQRLDGDGSSFSDNDQDQETEELAKLRCTSERTEVIAEREQRRRKRRCADYPGLAFGSSIFSSDTLMKFNIIKNELHNILNSQLKRVGLFKGR